MIETNGYIILNGERINTEVAVTIEECDSETIYWHGYFSADMFDDHEDHSDLEKLLNLNRKNTELILSDGKKEKIACGGHSYFQMEGFTRYTIHFGPA